MKSWNAQVLLVLAFLLPVFSGRTSARAQGLDWGSSAVGSGRPVSCRAPAGGSCSHLGPGPARRVAVAGSRSGVQPSQVEVQRADRGAGCAPYADGAFLLASHRAQRGRSWLRSHRGDTVPRARLYPIHPENVACGGI